MVCYIRPESTALTGGLLFSSWPWWSILSSGSGGRSNGFRSRTAPATHLTWRAETRRRIDGHNQLPNIIRGVKLTAAQNHRRPRRRSLPSRRSVPQPGPNVFFNSLLLITIGLGAPPQRDDDRATRQPRVGLGHCVPSTRISMVSHKDSIRGRRRSGGEHSMAHRGEINASCVGVTTWVN
jgi:hypothetical protein